ncbi:BadF/BadG/BcrA/BcrD ATPase family protein [Sphaerisporangium flaviroseum]|uniref:BadF/BadG/BcrA/BcrD ATPase family protein n=1 Tax=Sphaerisporangium flaviroseum TaxID=509199 RepID=A0ABP7HPV6_9ACTN
MGNTGPPATGDTGTGHAATGGTSTGTGHLAADGTGTRHVAAGVDEGTLSTRRLVVGVDGGGTSTRCLVATLDGEILARGQAGGANPRSARDAGGNLARALTEALSRIGPRFRTEDVLGGVFGLAGASEAGRRQACALATDAWRAAGLPGLPVVVPDILVAFAGATSGPTGSVIIAGTGAVAARIEDREITRRCDGYGWLLGDEGSGVWIGRRAVQAALTALDGRGRPTVLVDRVLPALMPDAAENAPATGKAPADAAENASGSGEAPARPIVSGEAPAQPIVSGEALAQAIVAAVYGGEPARLGTLSPVVEAAAREGDRVALTILDDAARLLVRTLETVGPGDPGLPVVLAGSLLTRPTLVAERVRESLPGRLVVLSRDGAAGAAALALRTAARAWNTTAPPAGDRRGMPGAEIEAAHHRLITTG